MVSVYLIISLLAIVLFNNNFFSKVFSNKYSMNSLIFDSVFLFNITYFALIVRPNESPLFHPFVHKFIQ